MFGKKCDACGQKIGGNDQYTYHEVRVRANAPGGHMNAYQQRVNTTGERETIGDWTNSFIQDAAAGFANTVTQYNGVTGHKCNFHDRLECIEAGHAFLEKLSRRPDFVRLMAEKKVRGKKFKYFLEFNNKGIFVLALVNGNNFDSSTCNMLKNYHSMGNVVFAVPLKLQGTPAFNIPVLMSHDYPLVSGVVNGSEYRGMLANAEAAFKTADGYGKDEMHRNAALLQYVHATVIGM